MNIEEVEDAYVTIMQVFNPPDELRNVEQAERDLEDE